MSVIDPPMETHNSTTSGVFETRPGSPQKDDSESVHQEPCSSTSSKKCDSDADIDKTVEMLGKLPPEIGMLLVLSGIAGILLPGPVGTPLLIAGGMTIWPKTFEPIERWFSRCFPKAHQEGVFQIKEFVSNLQRRFPDPE